MKQPDPTPVDETDPEPIGPLAEKFLDQLAAQQAAHRAEVFARLRRQKPAIRTRKEQP